MGKSPGKWIKTLLFGKKSSKSNLSKGRDSFKSVDEKGALFSAKTLPADPVVSAPLFSQPVSVTANRNERNSELERVHDGVVLRLGSQDTDVNGTGQSVASHDPERIREEKAAIKAQAAFRGYLARRAFRALRGIIRLQALVRGHLVRRQAVATLRCMQGIVKLQALVRGRRVRLSVIGIEVHEKCKTRNALEDAKHFGSVGVKTSSKQKEKLWKNAFICKHVASSTSVMPLRFQYDLGEPNSAWSWLALWTISRIWEPLPQVKKVTDSKSQTRSKRSVRRVPAANLENGSMRSSSELDKPKRNFRKVLSQPVDPVHGSPQNELEKVKRNLKKISSSTNGTAERVETEVGKPKHISKKAIESSAPDVPNRGMVEFLEKPKIETSVSVSKHRDIEDPVQSLVADEAVDVLPDDHTAVDTSPLENSAKDENIQVTNGELTPKQDKSSNENQKGSRRRASLPAKQEYPENGVQNSPKLPSYMAATESAKAKLRGLGSPKPGLDGVEQNGLMRRHSLPSAPNGMLSSLSPRTQKLVQASGKGGVKSDRSLLASRDRDGNEKVVHAEWKR